MSQIEVDKVIPQSGTALQVGDSGDTITIPAGATITNNGTATGFGSTDTDKVKVSSNDTTAGFLNGKLVAGTNISLTEGSDGGNETLTVASTAAGTTLSGSTNNTIPTVTGANALAGEANLTFDGSTLGVAGDMNVTKAGDNLKADFSNGVNANFRILTAGTVSQIGPSTASDIVFLSSNAERMRMLSAGGLTFNGDTAAANALDDYEEGTFTPTWGGNSSVSVNSGNYGYYTKIGNVVTVHFGAVLTSTSNSYYNITNAPFQSNIASGNAMGMGQEYGHTGYSYKTSIGDNSTTITVRSYQNNAVANAYLNCSLTYRTD
jgi:hypothetical protein